MIRIQRGRIDVKAVVDSVRRDDAGAIAVFLGTVRADPDVEALDYEVYTPMAIRTLTDLVDRAKAKFGVLGMSIVHRVGRVSVGGDSVAIACAAVHRAEAFAACAWAMEEVKRIVPIWKRESGPRTRRTPRRRSGARRKAREARA
jgi:molybdopterin synthase catalytic subunit